MRQAYDYWQDQPGISRTPLSSNREITRAGSFERADATRVSVSKSKSCALFFSSHSGARHPTNFPSVAEQFSNLRDFGARRPKPVMKQKILRGSALSFLLLAAFEARTADAPSEIFPVSARANREKNFSPESAPPTAQTVFRSLERRLHLLVRSLSQIFHFFPPSHIPKQLVVPGYKLLHSHLLHWYKWKFFILYLPAMHPDGSGGHFHYISPWKIFKNYRSRDPGCFPWKIFIKIAREPHIFQYKTCFFTHTEWFQRLLFVTHEKRPKLMKL